MIVSLDTNSIDDYNKFIRIKSLPKYRIRGGFAEFPDEYALVVGNEEQAQYEEIEYEPPAWAFDYQRDISTLAILKRKFAVFADCGLGKTIIELEFAHHASKSMPHKAVLIVCPLMVVNQTIRESERFYPTLDAPKRITASELAEWIKTGTGIGITNYEAITDDITQGNLGALILDESSMLKSHYGKWGTRLIELGKGLRWKLCLTGTPAPNDRIEYANHAVFLDHFTNVNAFLARFFVNRGQTDNRWELKPHALRPFYKSLSHWAIFLTNPATYGWKDNTCSIPPIHVHHERVPLTAEQTSLVHTKTGSLFPDKAGGIVSRSRLSQIAKGNDGTRKVDTNKPQYISELIDSWGDESTIIWCKYNAEQDGIAAQFPNAGNIDGTTSQKERERIIEEYKSGKIKILISKPKILGFGLNLQICTRMIFSGLQDSYEEFYQAVKRANRVGSTKPLNVHIVYTDIEAPMIETVLEKAKRVQHDTEQQEQLFKESRDSGYDN